MPSRAKQTQNKAKRKTAKQSNLELSKANQKHVAKNLCNYDEEQKFLCYICEKSFKTAEKTKKHISKDHKNEMMKEF